jgi:hypothetical protein
VDLGQCAAGEDLGSGASRPKKRPTPLLTASDLDLSHFSQVCPGLGSRLWGYAVRAVRPPYAHAPWASVGARTKPPGSGIPLGFFGTTRLVPGEPVRTASAPGCPLPPPPGTEVDLDRKSALIGPDRFGLGFEPPLTGLP